ncbi:MAG: Ig-like domain-containing protein [Thermoleophilia bacterium]
MDLPASIRLVGTPFGGGSYGWGIDGLAAYTLSPVAGAPVNSALTPTCREDNAPFAEAGAPAAGPSAFAPAGTPIGGSVTGTVNCSGLNASAAGFSAGISTGWQDVIDLSSANNAYFEIAGVAPGEGTFRARVDPTGAVAQGGGGAANDTDLRPIDVPGVVADQKAAVLTAAGKASLQLSAQIREPQVRGRRVTAASPANGADAAPATATLRYSIATPPAKGTAAVSPAGAVTYDSSAAPVADTFTVVAEDSRGLRSAPAKVFIDPPGSPRRVTLGRPDITKTVLRKSLRLGVGTSRSFTIKVPKGQKQATFTASWNGGTFGIGIRKPGTRKEIRKNARGITLSKARTFRSLKVTSPKAGAWRFTVTRKAGGPRLTTATIRATLVQSG